MGPASGCVARLVERVTTRQRLGPDAQVDDKALIIVPDAPWRTDPFLALSEDWFSAPGFEWHPPRGIETVTTVLDGVLEHGDNLGNAGALAAGDVQWMTAGRGIIHRELAHRDEYAHTLQLWVNLPAARKLTETRYQDLLATRRPVIHRDGAVIDVISGAVEGVSGPATNEVALQGALVSLEPRTSLNYPLPACHRVFAYVCRGSARVGRRPLAQGQTAWSDPVPGATSVLEISTHDRDDPAQLLIFSGAPIGEAVVFGGPFVMNRQEEIAQAFEDFRSGKFGPIPKMARVARR